MFEAIARSKIHLAIKLGKTFSYQIDKMQILMQNVIKNITKQNFDELVQLKEFVEFPQLKRDLANSILSWYGELTFKYNSFPKNK